MESQIQYTASVGQPEAALAPKKRFQIEKIEERMAPTAYGNPNKKSDKCDGGGGGGGTTSSGLSWGTPSIY